MLDPNNTEDLYSIEKCRNIKSEILRFGVNDNEILKIIDYLSLELEDLEKLRQIQSVLKNSNEIKDNINKEEKVDILLK
jgi:PP-loop superfamily ATP-utilizing enzyme